MGTWNYYREDLDDGLEPTDEQVWERLRRRRDLLLQSSDWTQVADAQINRAAWALYRQALRDLPQNTTDPRIAVWPTEPITDPAILANKEAISQQAKTAMAQNTLAINTTNPTTAQVIAQVKNLSAQNNKIIRLVLDQLDATD